MIGWLSGRVLHQLRNGALLVDVQGVGYEVHVASSEPTPYDEVVELFIFTVVREDAIQLFGFRTIEDREFFELLLVTPGVGPSTALGALRTMSVAELAFAVESDDAKKIATISGIGPKTASRIVLELKGKVTLEGAFAPMKASTHVNAAIDDALRALGYTSHEVRDALNDVVLPTDESAALRTALQLLRRS
ncbi:MAG TPA: Holliday junction branch migration protein RuvA [Acidimicrobiales bacterium]|nr:Holliday junction branch migration protein RuvA [Acidimicrobiales bacterium]